MVARSVSYDLRNSFIILCSVSVGDLIGFAGSGSTPGGGGGVLFESSLMSHIIPSNFSNSVIIS
ncbi:hypothetical protein KKG31_07880 [Patescibacteria group bacterium]|nr:hypothetical protein [Patescibacteria group bacterium]MBU1758985.1 hypothetical protein [Patescibacteria group bacterium]